MKRLTQISIVAWMGLVVQLASAQAPSWSVDPTQYQNSMNITAKVVINQNELTEDSDLLAAFVGTEVRGVANINVLVGSTGDKVAFLQVYSNQNAGEEITFKVYDDSEGTITDAITGVTFSNDAIIGSTADPLVITDNSPPTDISLSNSEINEGIAVGTVVGTLNTSDVDDNETFTYSIVTGDGDTNNDFFTINGNELQTASAINFEDNASLSVRIRSTDSRSASTEKSFTVVVNNTNDVPTALNLSNSTIVESTPSGALIGEFEVEDPDEDEEYAYALVEGAGDDDNDLFVVVANDLRLNGTLDFETQSVLEIRIQATSDEGGSITEEFELQVTNANEPPTELTVDALQFNENIPIGTAVATLSTVDEDAGETFSYSLIGTTNPDHAAFAIAEDKIVTAAPINFEDQSTYDLDVRVTDSGGNTKDEEFEFRVLDQNDQPSALRLDKSTIQENLSSGLLVGQLSTIDEDEDDLHSYSLVSGDGDTDNGLFIISGNQLLTNSTLDFETNPSHTVRIRTSDGELSTEASFEIAVINTNDDPTGLTLDNLSVNENANVGTVVGTFTLEDVDITNATYTMVAGANDNTSFIINGADLITAESFDFETDQQYSIDIQASDGDGGLIVRRFVITINDVNDPPVALLFSGSEISEDTPIGTVVGQLSTQDADADESFTYALESHTDAFEIQNTQVVTTAMLDFDVASSYDLVIRVTDSGGLSITETFTLSVLEVIPPNNPPVLDDSEISISENTPAGTVIGSVVASDPDGDDLIYSLKAGFDNEFIGFDAESQSISLLVDVDYETRSSYEITIAATDPGGLSYEGRVLILITDEVEPELLASNFISPNDDGFNDFFLIQSPGLYLDYRLTISNGSRQPVFTTIGYNNDWTGTTDDGTPLPQGLYYYSLKSSDGSTEFNGIITLER
ncbi:MAG: cadherin domain-containing protein [Bacteroidota bacterium]